MSPERINLRREVLKELTVNLSGGDLIDRRPEGILELRERREEDTDDSLRARRRVANWLAETLPQHVDIGESSQGRALRVEFADRNELIDEDVFAARDALGLPVLDLSTVEIEADWSAYIEGFTAEELTWVGDLPEGELVSIQPETLLSEWLSVHSVAWAGESASVGHLPDELYELAVQSAQADLSCESVPHWMRTCSDIPGAQPESVGDSDAPAAGNRAPGFPLVLTRAPVMWAAMCLTFRHRLPAHVMPALRAYLLTGDKRFLSGLVALEFEIGARIKPITSTSGFGIAMSNIDEHTTEDDIDWIRDHVIMPEIRRLRKEKGLDPEGKRSASRKRVGKYLPFYTGRKARHLDFEAAFERLIENGKLFDRLGDLEKLTVKNADRDMQSIFEPLEFGPRSFLMPGPEISGNEGSTRD